MLLALLACQQPDFAQEWELDRLRLLAIRAEPAEPRPGEVVTFTSLVYTPGGAEWQSVWFACLEGSDSGCTIDPALLDAFADPESLSKEELAALYVALQEAGLVGAEPYLPPTWTVPKDALDALKTEEQAEGLSATLQVTVKTADDAELVLKRLPVSLATTPNHNPDLERLEVDGVDVGAGLVADPGATYTLAAWLAGGREGYTYVTTEGVTEERVEEPSWRWYVDGGELADAGDEAGDEREQDYGDIAWTAPESGSGLLAAVALDGRGGMSWWTTTWEVR